MTNTTRVERDARALRLHSLAAIALLAAASSTTAFTQERTAMSSTPEMNQEASSALTGRQQAIIPIAAFAATGEMERLRLALEHGLEQGLTISEIRELLIQAYAYAGFPRSLNALSEFMQVLETRRLRGIEDVEGRAPGRPIPTGDALLAAGTANQTKLVGAPVTGPLFDFAPTANQYLRTHLFGDIFERDNMDWQSRELATVGMLAALQGVESQLRSHMRISMNVGLTQAQLRAVAALLERNVDVEAGRRASEALDAQVGAAGWGDAGRP